MDKVSIQFLFIFSLTKFVTSTSKLHFSQASIIYLLEKHHQATDEWTVRDKRHVHCCWDIVYERTTPYCRNTSTCHCQWRVRPT